MSHTKMPSAVAILYGSATKLELNAFMSTIHECNTRRMKPVLVGSCVRGQRYTEVIVLKDVDTSAPANNEWFAEFTATCIAKGDM